MRACTLPMEEASTAVIASTTLDELRSSALLLEVIADNVADLIAVVDCTGRRIWNNAAYAERLGYLPDELKGSDSLVEIHPDDLPLVRQTLDQSMKDGCGRRIEYRMRRKDGGWVSLESEGRIARHWNGHERVLVVVARDVTRRKQEEHEKQERSRRQIERAEALAELSSSDELQDGELAECFEKVATMGIKLSDFERASVWTMDGAAMRLTCGYRSGSTARTTVVYTVTEQPTFFALLHSERLIAVRSLMNDRRLTEIAEEFANEGATALLIVPLRRGSTVLGALICERTDEPHGWDLDEFFFVTSLSDSLVLALDARERVDAFHRLHESQQQLAHELREAATYVQSLLPAPMQGEIETEWRFIPSAALGGDAFGYHWLDADHFAIYLLDVVGHGVRAALVSVTLMNQLRTGSLAETDLLDPKQVLTTINEVFQMDEQDGMYFTLWYGVYSRKDRKIRYASAGHPPALLFSRNSPEPRQLHTRGLMIGAMPDSRYESLSCDVPPGSTLYVLSDGVYEIEQPSGATGTLRDLIGMLSQQGDANLDKVVTAARSRQRLETAASADDFSLVKLVFR